MMKWRITKGCRPLRGLDAYLRHIPGVSLTLHPRLYSAARIRGLRTRQNAGNDRRNGRGRSGKIKDALTPVRLDDPELYLPARPLGQPFPEVTEPARLFLSAHLTRPSGDDHGGVYPLRRQRHRV